MVHCLHFLAIKAGAVALPLQGELAVQDNVLCELGQLLSASAN